MATEHEIEHVAVSELTVHPANPRQGDIGTIVQSIQNNGWYGTIVAQRSTGYVLAGNHRLMAARSLQLETVPVYWVDVDDKAARRILLADNRSADLATYDDEKLVELLLSATTDDDLLGTGFDQSDVADLLLKMDGGLGGDDPDPDDPTRFPREVKSPVYQQTGDCPDVHEMYDRTRTRELLAEIDAATSLPADVADFLRSAAERHTAFRFDRIAEYYTHAPADIQSLMERSALVIIDFNRAVELGFVELREELRRLYDAEYGHDDD
jgi:hypothetical protein